MSDYNFLKQVPIEVPKRSGFDKSYKNLFTMPVGTLVPALVDEIIPNTKINLKAAINACLPPLASETFMNCKLKCEAFFVPTRLLYGGYESWLTGEKVFSSAGTYFTAGLPIGTLSNAGSASTSAGTLLDYLGVKFSKADMQWWNQSANSSNTLSVNLFPVVAYHKIYDDWYRNPLVQNPVFSRVPSNQSISATNYLKYLPSLTFSAATVNVGLGNVFCDGVAATALRQRNFDIDYFTTATPQAQAGTASKLSMTVANNATNFTISALRAANSVQQFLERNNISGPRMVDYVKAHYGAYLPAGVAQRTVYLGSGSIDVYTKGIYQNALAASGGGSVTGNNPFVSVGAQYGSANANGVVHLVDSFTAEEPGYLFVMVSLVPKVTYANGVNRMMIHYTSANSQSDMATPLLQNVGNQPIYTGELTAADYLGQPRQVFGYTDRYAEFCTKEDELHGLVRDGYSLQSFALQRTTSNGPAINSNFLAIPTTYLDQVAAATGGISDYGAWVDAYFDYKVAQPLQRYCIPSLQDPSYEHGDTVHVQRGGTHI